MPERGRVARDYSQMTEDLVNQVEPELYPEGKGEPVKGFKRKSDTACLKFRKMLPAATTRRKGQREGWNKTPGERRGPNGWEMHLRETFHLWCGEGVGGVDYTGHIQVCEARTS